MSPAEAAALRRAAELVVELNAVVASVRAHLAELETARSATASPAVAPEVEPAVESLVSSEEDSGLEPGELRSAFGAARAIPAHARPRWADSLLGDT